MIRFYYDNGLIVVELDSGPADQVALSRTLCARWTLAEARRQHYDLGLIIASSAMSEAEQESLRRRVEAKKAAIQQMTKEIEQIEASLATSPPALST